MEHIAAIMILVGCMNGHCSEVQAPVNVFETAEECSDMLRPTVTDESQGYKVFYGKCAAIDPALDYDDVSVSWAITTDDRLDVTISVENPYLLANLNREPDMMTVASTKK